MADSPSEGIGRHGQNTSSPGTLTLTRMSSLWVAVVTRGVTPLGVVHTCTVRYRSPGSHAHIHSEVS